MCKVSALKGSFIGSWTLNSRILCLDHKIMLNKIAFESELYNRRISDILPDYQMHFTCQNAFLLVFLFHLEVL